MYFKTKFCLILCAIPLIEAADLKIDGLLNLGDSWSYEYRIIRSDSSKPHLRAQEDSQEKSKEEIARDKEKDNAGEVNEDSAQESKNETHDLSRSQTIVRQTDEEAAQDKKKELVERRDEEIAHYNDKIARQKDEEAARIQRDAEHLRLAEYILRKQAGRLRKEARSSKMSYRQGQDQDAQIHYIHNPKQYKTVAKTETRIPKWSKNLNTETVGTNEASTEDSYNSDESLNSDNPKKEPTKINEDNATENLKKLLRDTTEDSDTQYSHSDSHDISANFKHKIRQGVQIPPENIIKINNYTTPKSVKEIINKTLQDMVKKTILQGKYKKENLSTTTKVTTVRTGEIFTNTHNVTDEKAILEFTMYLFTETLKIFRYIKEKTDQNHVKHKIDSLMRSYQYKFKEFVNDTNGQKIKTRLGTQKVILNTIDTSNLLLRRLMNFLLSDLDKKGLLRQNSGTTNRFQKAIDLELKLQTLHVCKKFGICRSARGFSSFIADVLDILLKADEIKFKQFMDAFTEVIKYMKFPHILEPETEKKLKIVVGMMEKQDNKILKALVLVVRNTISSQNKPLIVTHYSARRSIVNSTLAFFEVVDLLDTLMPPNRNNTQLWADVKLSLQDFVAGKRTDILDILSIILRSFRKKLRVLDKNSRAIISRNVDIILTSILDKTN